VIVIRPRYIGSYDFLDGTRAERDKKFLVGACFTGSVLWFARPILGDAEEELAPEFIGEAGKVATTVGRFVLIK